MSFHSPPRCPLPCLLLALYHIPILPSSLPVSLPMSPPPDHPFFTVTPTVPSVPFWVQACKSISQCYLHVNSSSQIFTIVPRGGEGWGGKLRVGWFNLCQQSPQSYSVPLGNIRTWVKKKGPKHVSGTLSALVPDLWEQELWWKANTE